MAKIKIKFGDNEIEIDSRDFYVDNQSVFDNRSLDQLEKMTDVYHSNTTESFSELEDIEMFEPEFSEASPISINEIKDKLNILASKSFFDTPRTVSETVEQLREYGWAASLLDVSMILAKMAFNREILKNSRENRNYYFVKEALLAN